MLVLRVSKREELVEAINDASTRGATALNVLASPMLFQNRHTVIEQAAHIVRAATAQRETGPVRVPLGEDSMWPWTPPPRTVIGDPVTSGWSEPKLLGAFSILRS